MMMVYHCNFTCSEWWSSDDLHCAQLGFGGVMGICTGVALKRIGNGIAALVGKYDCSTDKH